MAQTKIRNGQLDATLYRSGGTDVAVGDGGTGSSTAAGAATNLGLGTGDSPQFTAVNIGHATDTTITRVSAGVIAVEGKTVGRKTRKRWVKPNHWAIGATSTTPTVGRVYLELFEVMEEITVDGISINNVATVAGNVTVGIYGPIATEETCSGEALIVQSASTAVSGTNAPQLISLSATTLAQGRYYAAVEFSNATNTYQRSNNTTQVVGWTQYYDRGGGYGALTDPCPAPTNGSNAFPTIVLRCSA